MAFAACTLRRALSLSAVAAAPLLSTTSRLRVEMSKRFYPPNGPLEIQIFFTFCCACFCNFSDLWLQPFKTFASASPVGHPFGTIKASGGIVDILLHHSNVSESAKVGHHSHIRLYRRRLCGGRCKYCILAKEQITSKYVWSLKYELLSIINFSFTHI